MRGRRVVGFPQNLRCYRPEMVKGTATTEEVSDTTCPHNTARPADWKKSIRCGGRCAARS